MPSDPYKYFRTEARELCAELGKGVLELERAPAPEIVAQMLRVAHTLKGAARVVKQREIAELAHAVEEALAPHRDARSAIARDVADTILRHLDAIGRSLAALAPPPEGGSTPAEVFENVRADAADTEALIHGLAEVHAGLGALRRQAEALARARGLATAAARKAGEELAALLASVEQALADGIDRAERDLGAVREAAERLRLVPAGAVFGAIERAVRDAALTLGKRAAFDGRGGEVRLDAQVLAALQGALLQVAANAVAHGIEPEAERRAAGKAPEGRVVLEVGRRGRRVLFRCRDDGRGVDLEAVRRAAERRGLRSAETERLGADELMRLVLRGGITTSGAATELAGRGIGLDLVREAAERLGGEVTVRTESGRGTTVDIDVPLSVASLDGLVVEAGGVAAVIPLDAVRRTMRLRPGDVAQSPQGEALVHDGKVVPLLSLDRALAARARGSRARSVVIVQAPSGTAAVGVERLLGTTSVVLRALPALAPAAAVVAGASFDAEGRPRMVLDPDGLVAEAQRAGPAAPEPAARRAPILVVDDSLTTRMLEQSILESAGYEVDVAVSGEEALEKARARRYALLLVDVEMPNMDGFTLLERMRSDPALRDVPSILVTSRASPEDRRRGLECGAAAYIVKSEFDQRELLERIGRLVG
jgi:two-component system chemotaxis sensor kinase CheA